MMIDRRALLQSGAVASAAMLLPATLLAGGRDDEPAFEQFVFDRRAAYSRAAAQSVAARGIRVSAVDGDVTALWYDDLSLRWRQRPMTIAGHTGEDVLFVLSTLAPEYRMRVLHQQLLGVADVNIDGLTDSLPIYSWVIGSQRS